MTIKWTQKAWSDVKKNGRKSGEKRCWKWEGKRPDGRSFHIIYIASQGFVASSFNGTRIGAGKSLSEAQRLCEQAPQVSSIGVRSSPLMQQVLV